jgi:uncharacterized damage-inducible protein DinB
MNTTLTALFQFKQRSDAELMDALSKLTDQAHATAKHAATRIMNHIRVVDEIFIGHLRNLPHGHEATNTADTPTLEDLRAKLLATGKWYENFCATLPYPMLGEVLPFTFTDGDAGRMNREEILMHVITHGGYHRGAAGRILVQCGIPAPRELFTRYLHDTEPERRGV